MTKWIFNMLLLGVVLGGLFVPTASAQMYSVNPDVTVCDQASLTLGGGAYGPPGSPDCVNGTGEDLVLLSMFTANYAKPSGDLKQTVFCVNHKTCDTATCPDATQVVNGVGNIGKFNNDLAAMNVGDVAVWIFWDTHSPHSATADDGTWSTSLNQKSGNTEDRDNTAWAQFNAPGTVNYHCMVHPISMHGTIVVGGKK